jgi:hypothetical protein
MTTRVLTFKPATARQQSHAAWHRRLTAILKCKPRTKAQQQKMGNEICAFGYELFQFKWPLVIRKKKAVRDE